MLPGKSLKCIHLPWLKLSTHSTAPPSLPTDPRQPPYSVSWKWRNSYNAIAKMQITQFKRRPRNWMVISPKTTWKWSGLWKDARYHELLPPPCMHAQSCLTACHPVDCSPPQAPLSMGLPRQSTGMGSHFLHQGIFLTPRSNLRLLCLLHLKMDSLPLSNEGSPSLTTGEMQIFPLSFWVALGLRRRKRDVLGYFQAQGC